MINILLKKSTGQKFTKAKGKIKNATRKHGDNVVLFYRWLIFLFSAVLCINGAGLNIRGYAIFESLAVVAVYNSVVTAYSLKHGDRFTFSVLYLDIIMFMLLIFFSGGIKSDLYIFLFFTIGFYGVSNEIAFTMKIGAFCTLLYTVTCILSSRYHSGGTNYTTLVIKDLIFLMAALLISRINSKVKKYDEMRKKEFKLARTDKLTGLANRHYFDQKLMDEAEYALNNNSTLNVLLFDLDDFKSFNDTYGHISGDRLLALFADIIMKCLRKSDIPVRYGGEEFLILIRDLDIIIAKSVGERIRRQLEKQHNYLAQQKDWQRVTVSCGVAQFPMHSRDIKEVIVKADQALYHAKKIGKNIVVCYDDIGKSREMLENDGST